jgi:hypothetical protein
MSDLQTIPQRTFIVRDARAGDVVALRPYPSAMAEPAKIEWVGSRAIYLRFLGNCLFFLKSVERGQRLALWMQDQPSFVYVR